jgi:hypothetical protein
MVGRHGKIGLARRRDRIAHLGLESGLWRQSCAPGSVQQVELGVGDARNALEAGDEHVRQRLVAVHVEREIDARLVHAVAHASTSGERSGVGFAHSRFRLAPAALVRR